MEPLRPPYARPGSTIRISRRSRERVLIFDGATGTNLQLRHLDADDFGGPTFEGCNEILTVTRPNRRRGVAPILL